MTTYTVYFRTDAQRASHDIEADTPEQALALAREIDAPRELWFDPYDDMMPVNEIVVTDPDGEEVAGWLDDDVYLRNAARDLLDAAELVVARWARGDLAEAVRELDAAIAKAKGGAA